MGPLWSGQGTVPHCTVSDLLSTDVLVSPSGALVGAEERRHEDIFKLANIKHYYSTLCGVDSRKDCVTRSNTIIHSHHTDSTVTARRKGRKTVSSSTIQDSN